MEAENVGTWKEGMEEESRGARMLSRRKRRKKTEEAHGGGS